MKSTKTKGLPPGYSEKDIPGSSNADFVRKPTKVQAEMTSSLMEMPGGKPLPGDKK